MPNPLNVLIDTNIVIPLEDTGRELDSSLAEIKRLSDEQVITLRTHPLQREEILRDRNESRRNIVLSRLQQYQHVPNPPQWTEDEINNMGLPKVRISENEMVDNALLCAVYRNAVHLLLTEDKGIHRKAICLGIQDRVYYIASFLGYLRNRQGSSKLTPPLGIKRGYLHQFDIRNIFFDSLRAGYPGFNNWFDMAARCNRECWYIGDSKEIGALVIWKIEKNEPVTINHILWGKALKLCTFKVSTSLLGRKVGERLLYTAFQYASHNRLDWVYLTLEDDAQKYLSTLCADFGFENIGIDIKNNRDDVWCKRMQPPPEEGNITNLEYAIKYYPLYKKDCSSVKWLVPIQPEFHEMLFPDVSEKIDWLPGIKDDFSFYEPYANTIKKAYLCHAKVKGINSGDLVYFYRSQDRRSIQCVGIVEDCFRSSDQNKILGAILKRTVYSQQEIDKITSRETLVILFRFLEYLIPPINAEKLLKKGILGPIQSIRKIAVELS